MCSGRKGDKEGKCVAGSDKKKGWVSMCKTSASRGVFEENDHVIIYKDGLG